MGEIRNAPKRSRGAGPQKFAWFTLVELIVVVTILAILATVGFLALSGYSQDAKDASVKSNVRSVMTAISSESAITNNSPRYYVVHDAAAALTWSAIAYVDGNPVALTGGDWNVSGTNYSAGNPNWTILKLNPDKFKVASFPVWLERAFAAYDWKSISVGAIDASLPPTASGRNRTASFFQVAGIAPANGLATVSGSFPQPTTAQAALGAVSGLVKNPSSSSNTGALVDGNSSSSGMPMNSCAANPAFANIGTLTTGTPSSIGQAWTYSAAPGNCTYSCKANYTGTGCAYDQYWSQTTFLSHFDGPNSWQNFVDQKGHPISAGDPGAVNSSASGKFWSCAYFTNTSSFIKIDPSSDFYFPSGTDFTVEGWFNGINTAANRRLAGQSGLSPGWQFHTNTSGNAYFYEGTTWMNTGVIPAWSGYHHIAATRQGNTVRLFLDGNLAYTVTNSGNIGSSTVGTYVGRWWSAVDEGAAWVCVDDFRVTKGVARYVANFEVPTSPYPDQ